MSIQSEIARINNNVQSALSICADAGVPVAAGANSDALPAAVSALVASVPQILTFTVELWPICLVYEPHLYYDDSNTGMYILQEAVSGVLATDKIIHAEQQMAGWVDHDMNRKADFDEIFKITPYNGGFKFWYFSPATSNVGDAGITIDITVVR